MKFTRKNLLSMTSCGIVELKAKIAGRQRKFRATTDHRIIGENVEQTKNASQAVVWDTDASSFKTVDVANISEIRIFATDHVTA